MPASSINAERDDWGLTLAFWLTLLVAGTVFAGVSLAPKLKTLAGQQAEYAANQRRLVALEHRADELERVATAFVDDPAFATAVARVEFQVVTPGEERIAVPPALRLGAGRDASPVRETKSVSNLAFAMPVLEPLASNTRVRIALLALAATLVAAAFAVLNDAHAATVRAVAGQVGAISRAVVGRYRKA